MNWARARRSLALSFCLLTLGLTGPCGSCDKHEQLAIAVVVGWAGTGKVNAKVVKLNHIMRLRSGTAGGGVTIRPNREVYKPFRFEATLGLPDEKHAELGANGNFGVSVVDARGVGASYSFDVIRTGAGIVVEARSSGTTPIATLAIPDALAADVAIESVGGVVVFSARKHGDDPYQELGAASAFYPGPYQLSLDASVLPKGVVVGFDLFRLTKNGAPTSPTTLQTARETIYTAIDALAEAMYALDGDAPDRVLAGDQIDAAVLRLDAALAMDLTAYKTTRTKAKAARKSAAKLVASVRGRRSPHASIVALVSIVKAAGLAANALR